MDFNFNRHHIQIVKIPGDGNCLFSAIAHQINNLFGITFNHTMVRYDLVKYIEENKKEERIWLALLNNIQDVPDNTGISAEDKIEHYIRNLYTDGIWGGEDILIAASEYYLVNVHIL